MFWQYVQPFPFYETADILTIRTTVCSAGTNSESRMTGLRQQYTLLQ